MYSCFFFFKKRLWLRSMNDLVKLILLWIEIVFINCETNDFDFRQLNSNSHLPVIAGKFLCCVSSYYYCCFPCFLRVAQAYVNQRKLDHEVKTLQVQASQFSKQTAQWISMVEGFNQALKVGSTLSEISKSQCFPVILFL